ncbi:unnamed protein product [Prunus armeniaca]|uniref:Uncharacterized protein n=1 Tax=Prunus armeniaca TaxID=36596 RepID=A0A6J5XZM3_PRUAR|nr:unnamed protein product [Prunus armeniaca]
MSAGWFSQPCSEIEDRIFKHCPCSLVFQQEKEKKKAQAKANIAEKESPLVDMIKRESSAKSAAANSRQGEKRPNAPIQGDSPTGNIMPSQTFLRHRKVSRNLSPQGAVHPFFFLNKLNRICCRFPKAGRASFLFSFGLGRAIGYYFVRCSDKLMSLHTFIY